MDTEKIKEKVKNLKNRTVENGATKEEAETALKLAQKLIDKYGLEKPKAKTVVKVTRPQPQTAKEAEGKVYNVKKRTHILKKILYFYLATKIGSFAFSVLLLCLISCK